jgi:hypothetical protein
VTDDDLDLDTSASVALSDTPLENVTLTAQGLYETLVIEEQVIITLEEESFQELKRSLIGIKGKNNMRLDEKGLAKDTSKLVFNYLPTIGTTPVGCIRVQISLQKKKMFTVAKIEKPSEF